jgi:hypothetical protein
LPDYFGAWQLARWIGGGTTAADIDAMPVHEVMEARIVMGALNQAERDAHEQQSRKGRKR